MIDEIQAICTWGDGPDVLLVLKGKELMLLENPYHYKPPQGDGTYGFIKKGSLCLTASEARILSHELIQAAKEAEELDRLCMEYDKHEKNKSQTR